MAGEGGGTDLGFAIDAQVHKDTFGESLKDLGISLAIEAVAIARLVKIQIDRAILGIAVDRVPRQGGVIVTTAVGHFATTTTIAWPFSIALQGWSQSRKLETDVCVAATDGVHGIGIEAAREPMPIKYPAIEHRQSTADH